MRRLRQPGLLVLILAGLLTATAEPALSQIQIKLTPTRDNTLFEETPTQNSNGSGNALFAGRINQGPLRRALLAFDDLPSLLPGVKIVAVELALHVSRSRSPEAVFNIHRVTSSWGEGASNAAEPGGIGTAAQTQDATWQYRFFEAESWATAGGDYEPVPSSSTAVGGVFTYVFPSTPALVSDVERWLADPSTNHGWLLRGDETEGMTSARRFNSRESAEVTFKPELNITIDLSQAALSGLYFATETPGEGYLVFATISGTVFFYFGYNDDGTQLWLISDTLTDPIALDETTTLSMRSGTGGTFSSPVPPESLSSYGTLDVLFDGGCLGGTFTLTGPEGEKSQSVVKLANIAGTDCP